MTPHGARQFDRGTERYRRCVHTHAIHHTQGIRMKKLLLALLAPVLAQAQTVVPPASPARFLFGVGVSGGGDKLVSGQYEDGSGVDIHAGGPLSLTAGVDYHFIPEFSLQGTINYHVDDASA